MSAALDAAVTAGIYLAWAAVILAGVVGIAAFAARWLPDHRSSRPPRREERTEAPPATRESGDWEWPLRTPPFDADAYLAARRLARAFPPGAVVGTAGPGWIRYADGYRGSLAERAVENVYREIEK